MSKTLIPFHSPDITLLARALVRRFQDIEHTPGHVEMLNLLAQASGFRNFQALRASYLAKARLVTPQQMPTEVDYRLIKRLRSYFDNDGRLIRKPKKYSHLQHCLWIIWSRLPPRQTLHERELNTLIQAQENIGDHVLLRRELVDGGWLTRTADGSEYRRLERRMPVESIALMKMLSRPAEMENT